MIINELMHFGYIFKFSFLEYSNIVQTQEVFIKCYGVKSLSSIFNIQSPQK